MIETNAAFTGNLAKWEKDDKAATDKALKDVATFVKNAIRDRLIRGFKSGRFVDGQTAASLEVSRLSTVKGERVIRVGANTKLGGWKARLWELGHVNKWTGRFERVQHWANTFALISGQIPEMFRRSYEARMTLWKSTPGRRQG